MGDHHFSRVDVLTDVVLPDVELAQLLRDADFDAGFRGQSLRSHVASVPEDVLVLDDGAYFHPGVSVIVRNNEFLVYSHVRGNSCVGIALGLAQTAPRH